MVLENPSEETSPLHGLLELNQFEQWAKMSERHAAEGNEARARQCKDIYESPEAAGVPMERRQEFRDAYLSRVKPHIAAIVNQE